MVARLGRAIEGPRPLPHRDRSLPAQDAARRVPGRGPGIRRGRGAALHHRGGIRCEERPHRKRAERVPPHRRPRHLGGLLGAGEVLEDEAERDEAQRRAALRPGDGRRQGDRHRRGRSRRLLSHAPATIGQRQAHSGVEAARPSGREAPADNSVARRHGRRQRGPAPRTQLPAAEPQPAVRHQGHVVDQAGQGDPRGVAIDRGRQGLCRLLRQVRPPVHRVRRRLVRGPE